MEQFLFATGAVFFLSALVGSFTVKFHWLLKTYWIILISVALWIAVSLASKNDAEFAFFLIFVAAAACWYLISILGLGFGRMVTALVYRADEKG